MKEFHIDSTVNLTVAQLYDLYVGSEFQVKYQTSRGDSQVECTEWQPTEKNERPKNGCTIVTDTCWSHRTVTFDSPLKIPTALKKFLGCDHTHIIVHQWRTLNSDSSLFCVAQQIITAGLPMCGAYDIQADVSAVPDSSNPNQASVVRIHGRTAFTQRLPGFKSMIENQLHVNCLESQQAYLAALAERPSAKATATTTTTIVDSGPCQPRRPTPISECGAALVEDEHPSLPSRPSLYGLNLEEINRPDSPCGSAAFYTPAGTPRLAMRTAQSSSLQLDDDNSETFETPRGVFATPRGWNPDNTSSHEELSLRSHADPEDPDTLTRARVRSRAGTLQLVPGGRVRVLLILWFFMAAMLHFVFDAFFVFFMLDMDLTTTGSKMPAWVMLPWQVYATTDTRYISADKLPITLGALATLVQLPLCVASFYALLRRRPWYLLAALIISFSEIFSRVVAIATVDQLAAKVTRVTGHIQSWSVFVAWNILWMLVPFCILLVSLHRIFTLLQAVGQPPGGTDPAQHTATKVWRTIADGGRSLARTLQSLGKGRGGPSWTRGHDRVMPTLPSSVMPTLPSSYAV